MMLSKDGRGGRVSGLFKDWRILVLLAFFTFILAIYVPSPLGAGFLNGFSGNLKYWLNVSGNVGGASVLLELEGVLVKINAPEMKENEICDFLQQKIGAEVIFLNYNGERVFEIRKGLSKEELEKILNEINASIGLDNSGKPFFVDDLTHSAVDETRRSIEAKLKLSGLKDATIKGVGRNLLMVDIPGVSVEEAKRIVMPGKFEIQIQTAGTGSEISRGQKLSEIRNMTTHVLYGDDIDSVSPVPERSGEEWGVAFKLSEGGAKKLREAMLKYHAVEEPEKHELVMLLEDDVIYSAPLSPDAAKELKKREIYDWIMHTEEGEEGYRQAKELIVLLRAAVCPIPVKIIKSTNF